VRAATLAALPAEPLTGGRPFATLLVCAFDHPLAPTVPPPPSCRRLETRLEHCWRCIGSARGP